MHERRRTTRRKTFLGARLVLDGDRRATLDGLVRNMADEGAKLVLPCPTIVPDEFEFEVAHLQRTFRARVAWRHADALGVSFVQPASGAA